MMNDSRGPEQPGPSGLCPRCANVQVITSSRGSRFYLCRLSFTDPRFPRYPPMPVVECIGYVSIREMHTIEPARLKQGATVESIPETPATTSQSDALIRGKALMFWDPMSLPGTKFAKKLEAIDTDQITPAADCVSESLDTLDERWKAGSFRYLMPDFRARVHRGENFIIAGDRFAIGSSREMSPAGLKGVAEEAGLEMVVVAGNNMGDIFRRNSFNLGLHVVQSPEAVADAQDGDEFSFDPVTRRLRNETQAEGLRTGSAIPEGRGDPAERRDLRRRPP